MGEYAKILKESTGAKLDQVARSPAGRIILCFQDDEGPAALAFFGADVACYYEDGDEACYFDLGGLVGILKDLDVKLNN